MKNQIISKIEKEIRENGPSILTGLGVVGLISTVGLAIKATRNFDKEQHKSKEDKIKAVLKHYYPVFIFGAGSIACIIGSNSMNMKRNLALAGAYKLSEDKLIKYKDKLFDNGKKENDDNHKKNIIIFGDSDIDCYDQMSGRYFKSDLDTIKGAVDQINNMLYFDEPANLNDFYENVGLDIAEIYSDMYWNPGNGPVKLDLSSDLNEKSRPILVVDFDIKPQARMRY